MKRLLKSLKWLVVIVVLLLVLFVVNSLYGNPISKIIINRKANEYINTIYSNLDLKIKEINYNFKFSNYVVKIKSDTSIDTHFTLEMDYKGKILYDSYDNDVLGRWNTFSRINSQYRDLVNSVINKQNISYIGNISYGKIDIDEDNEFDIKMTDLKLDYEYDINDLGEKLGHIVFYSNDDPSFEKIVDILLDLKMILDSNEISFNKIDINFERQDNQVYAIRNFSYNDINATDLLERVRENNRLLLEYYNEKEKTS